MDYKFKIGDKVRVLDGSNIPDYTGAWAYGMNKSVGQIGTVTKRLNHFGKQAYELDLTLIEVGYTYDERGLELVETKEDVTDDKGIDKITITEEEFKEVGFKAIRKFMEETKDEKKADPMIGMMEMLIGTAIVGFMCKELFEKEEA